MERLVEKIGEDLRSRGFAHVAGPLGREAYVELSRALGTIVGSEKIALRPGAHAYVAKPGFVPLHTDHPDVEVIGWWCEQQDAVDGVSLLFDGRPLIESMTDETRGVLREVELECPPITNGPPTERRAVLRSSRRGELLFASPWLRSPANAPAAHAVALEKFRVVLSDTIKREAIEVRLAAGDALFVDNQRVLHGRRAIATDSKRVLHRVWLDDVFAEDAERGRRHARVAGRESAREEACAGSDCRRGGAVDP